jgi:hypothetical protein
LANSKILLPAGALVVLAGIFTTVKVLQNRTSYDSRASENVYCDSGIRSGHTGTTWCKFLKDPCVKAYSDFDCKGNELDCNTKGFKSVQCDKGSIPSPAPVVVGTPGCYNQDRFGTASNYCKNYKNNLNCTKAYNKPDCKGKEVPCSAKADSYSSVYCDK